ncbi:MAG: HlyD family secretion protein [Hyphomicrobiales bacterium]|nr:HlyD family secretion protein [Hyphomicrobiales bacterium]
MAEPARRMETEPGRPTLQPVTAEAPQHEQRAELHPKPQIRKPRNLRGPLLLAGPLVAIALGLWAYLAGGRFATTDDAYVKADIVNVANDISGIVVEVDVKEGQDVRKGDLLFRLDDEPYRIAREGAEAQLGIIVNQLMAAKANYAQARAQIEQAKADLDFYAKTRSRQTDLLDRKVTTQAAADQAQRDYLGAQSRLVGARKQVDSLLAQLSGKPDQPVEKYAQYEQAKAALDKADRDLRRTRVIAPVDGVATNVAQVQPGNYIAAAQTAMNIVSRERVWVDAALKETDLAHVKVGDPATIAVDAYGGRVWKAHVASIAPATGSEFAVLPAQNSSGNWVKVVQRLTVRIAVEPEKDAPPLRAGMSVMASIDTGVKRSLATLPRDLMHMVGL